MVARLNDLQRRLLTTAGAGLTALLVLAPTPAPAQTAAPPQIGGCFAPLAGHPTDAEQRAFLEDLGPLATGAERRHGVPAAALVAIAVQESGYGWTQLAQSTHNVLAWKHSPAIDTGGRATWTLECPELGSKDEYIAFSGRADAVEFVARQLASLRNYRADTERYRQDRAAGIDVATAVDRWVDGIADPYSTDAETYRRTLRRIMNDPLAPSDRASPERNLYRLSERVPPAG